MKFLTVLAALLALLVLSVSAYADGKKDECDRCDDVKAARSAHPKPTNARLICVEFNQNQRGNVSLILWRGGKVVKTFVVNGVAKYRIERTKEAHDSFCLGSQLFEMADFVDICNLQDAHSIRGASFIARAREQAARTGRGHIKMCLLGDERCPLFRASER